MKPDKTIPALYGGTIMGIISSIPVLNLLNCLCCAPILLGGLLAVYFYKKNFTSETPPLTSNDCITVGALSGVFGAIIATVLSLITVQLFGNITMEMLLEWLRNAEIDLPEEFWESMEQGMSDVKNLGQITLGLIVSLIIYSIFGLLGGLIGYSIFKPKQQVMTPPYTTPL